jgi:calcineurin-like phosphoesterase family protein
MLYFTSDLHLGHKNIIRHCNRPFDSVEEMDQHLIAQINECVGPKDTLYILGDFSYRAREPSAYLAQLVCPKVILIMGNHDDLVRKNPQDYNFAEVRDYLELRYNKQLYVLSHYPFVSWRNSSRGSIHLHGHCHGTLKVQQKNRFDVGVDVHNFRPVSLTQVQELANAL